MLASRFDGYTLTSAQAAIWAAQQISPGSLDYILSDVFEIRGRLNLAIFRKAVIETLRPIDQVNVRFFEVNGIPRQLPAGTAAQPEVVDLTGAADAIRIAEQDMRAQLNRPVDLTSGPWAANKIYQIEKDFFLWFWAIHHIVADGIAAAQTAKEIAATYSAMVRGEETRLTDIPSLDDVIAEDQDYWDSDIQVRDAQYWSEQIDALPAPVHLVGPGSGQSGTAVRCRLFLTDDITDALRNSGRKFRTSWTVVMLSAVTAYLHHATGRDDVVIGMPVTGRTTPVTRKACGTFSNVVPLLLAVEPEMSVAELVRATSQSMRAALKHQRYPVFKVQKKQKGSSKAALWGVAVNIMSFDYGVTFDDIPAVSRTVSGSGPSEGLSINIYDRPGSPIALEFEADSGSSDRDELIGHLNRFALFLETFIQSSGLVRELTILSPSEVDWLMKYADGGSAPYPEESLHRLFEDQVKKSPDRLAVCCGSDEASYQELNARADRLAAAIRPLIEPGQRIGIFVERSVDSVVAVLAVLKAGGCYVPLDPSLPQTRLEYIAQDAGLRVAVTQSSLQQRTPASIGSVVSVDGPATTESGNDTYHDVTSAVTDPLRPAYVLYTSGSTGRPKGVVVSHRAAVNFTVQNLKACQLDETARYLGFASLSFDMSVLEIFGALLSGAVLVLATEEERRDPDRLQALISGRHVSVADLPPALLPLLDSAALPSLTFLTVGGDAPSADIVSRWTTDTRQVWNTYGPTETTVVVTMHRCDPMSEQAPPIGRPTANHQMYVVNSRLALTPPGVPGELCVAGTGLADGYLNRPDLTAERFVKNPWAYVDGERMYRTGDLVRWTPEGELEFLGRIDQQVKINGYRVEPGEIEAELIQHPDVWQVAVVPVDDPAGRHLIAYLVARDGVTLDQEELERNLSDVLPHYMVPHRYVMLDHLPVTPNGKLDRAALSVPPPLERTVSRAPSTDRERVLCELLGEVLGLPPLGVGDNFFALGGDSITAMSAVSRARAAGVVIELRDLFEQRTVADLVQVPERTNQSVLDTGPAHGPLPLTPIMHWFADHSRDLSRFSQQLTLKVPASLGHTELVTAFDALLSHHDALRMQVVAHDHAGWSCTVRPVETVRAADLVSRVDITSLEESQRRDVVARESSAAVERLDPQTGVNLQVIWFDAGADEPGLLHLAFHHLVVDGVSWRILIDDLATAWRAAASQQTIRLPDGQTSFCTWARQLATRANEPGTTAELPHWTATLEHTEEPLGRRELDASRDTFATSRELLQTVPADITEPLLHQAPATLEANTNDVLLAALALALQLWRSETHRQPCDSMLLDLEGHGRDHRPGKLDVSRTVGWFTTQFPLAVDLTGLDLDDAWRGGTSLALLVTRVSQSLHAVPNSGLGFGLLRYLNTHTSHQLARLPAPQILFNYLGRLQAGDGTLWMPAEGVDSLKADSPATMAMDHGLDINVLVRDTTAGSQMQVSWRWPAALFDEDEVSRLAHHWRAALKLLSQQTTHRSGTGRPDAGTRPGTTRPTAHRAPRPARRNAFRRHGTDQAFTRLICFPHAGGTAGVYNPWQLWLPGSVEMLAAQYPGRQDRLTEPSPHSIQELAQELLEDLAPHLDRPVVLFGHSMGALVAYEVARLIEHTALSDVTRLIVSSREAPSVSTPTALHLLDDDSLAAAAGRLAGLDTAAYNVPELRPMLLPSLRADLHLAETYRHLPGNTLRAPLSVFAGDADPQCSAAEMAGWADFTTGAVTTREFPGGHFYLEQNARDVVSAIFTQPFFPN